MRFSIFQDSSIGRRSVNQDRMGYCFTRDCLLMVVADGMGGHMRGEVAAQIALQTIAGGFQGNAQPTIPEPRQFLDQALRRAHRDILRYQEVHGLPESPRTTIVAAIIQDGRAWWAHAGDARLYWLRGNEVLARTRDHSKVQNLVALGLIDASEQETHPERNKVLNCLGSPFEPTVEISAAAKLKEGDTLVLCSDGLWSGVHEAELAQALSKRPVKDAIPDLVRRAVAAQGPSADNTTALAATWEGESLSTEVLSSLDVPEGAMTTTINFGQFEEEAPASDLSEEEIERTIREIRSAIQKTGGA